MRSTHILFYSSVKEAIEVIQEAKNSALIFYHFLCHVYRIDGAEIMIAIKNVALKLYSTVKL